MASNSQDSISNTIGISEAGAIRRLYKRKVSEAIRTTMRKSGEAVTKGSQRNGPTYKRIRKIMAKHLRPAIMAEVEKDFVITGLDEGESGKLQFAVAGFFGRDNYGVKNQLITCSDHILDRIIQDLGLRDIYAISPALWSRVGHCVLFHIQGDLPEGKSLLADNSGFCVLTHRPSERATDLVTWVPRSSWTRTNEHLWGDRVDQGEILLEHAPDE